MAKDPTFPFYAQDYLVDTLRWTRGMKSLHIDLLAESWVNGGLIDEDDHPAGLQGEDLLLWERIKHKWEKRVGFWVNEKLEEVRERRQAFRKTQSENGKLGGRPKRATGKDLKANPFILEKPEETQPFLELKPKSNPKKSLLEKEIEIEIENELKEEGAGETYRTAVYLIPQMQAAWKTCLPEYPEDAEKDWEALGRLAEFLCKRLGLPYNPRDGDTVAHILALWERLAGFIAGHDFFKNYSLQQVQTHSQNIYQSMKNGRRKNPQNVQPGAIVIPAGPRKYGKL